MVAFVLAVLVASRMLIPPLWQRVRILYWQRQCMTFVQPTDGIAADADHMSGPPTSATTTFGRFYNLFSPPGGTDLPVVFMHARSTPAGQPRLVVAQAEDDLYPRTVGDYLPSMALYIMVVRPGSISHAPTDVWDPIKARSAYLVLDGPRQMSGGQADPADPTHFTIEGIRGRHRWQIDGWVRDDDTVAVDCRRRPDVEPVIPAPPSAPLRRAAAP